MFILQQNRLFRQAALVTICLRYPLPQPPVPRRTGFLLTWFVTAMRKPSMDRRSGACRAAALMSAALMAAAPVAAAGIYGYTDAEGTLRLTDIPDDPRFELLLAEHDGSAPLVGAKLLPMRSRPYHAEIATAARIHGVDPALLHAVISAESAYRAQAGFTWDAANLRASLPQAQQFVSKEYRKGFEVVGLLAPLYLVELIAVVVKKDVAFSVLILRWFQPFLVVGFIRVKGDRCGSLPVADVAGPTFRMRFPGRLVDGFALLQDGDVLSTVALTRGDKTDAAMAMLLVVPRKKSAAEAACILDTSESFWELWNIFNSLKSCFREGIVVADMRP